MVKNEKCAVSDSEICKWLGKECKDCFINEINDKDEALKVLNDFRVTVSLLPDNFDTLLGEECCFCKGEQKQTRKTYAIVDLAHSEPESKKGMFFGMGKKVRQRIGSLLPISISICKKCRNNFRILDIIKWAALFVSVGIAVGIIFIPAVNVSPVMPYAIVLAGGIVGYIAGKLLSSWYLGKKSIETCFNVFEIPVCAQMRDDGWFTVQDDSPVTHFLFSRKPLMKKLSDICEREKKSE